jgi:hypothetical protein
MQILLVWIARLAGLIGVATMAVAIAARLAGAYWLWGFQLGTVLQAGMAATLAACLAYIAVLVERPGAAAAPPPSRELQLAIAACGAQTKNP